MSKFCPFCGEELVDEAKFCKNCGKDVSAYSNIDSNQGNDNSYHTPAVEKSHTAALILGIIFALFIPLIGFIIGVYLLTRKNDSKAKKYGIIIVALSVFRTVMNFLTLSFMNYI